jgi:hypothetical protein
MYDNYQFLSDPAEYLKRQAVSCYLQQGAKYAADIGSAGASNTAVSVAQPFAFDIVDGPMAAMGVKELRIIGPAIPPPPVNPYNPKIIGNWIPYLGQPNSSDFSAFGRIRLEDVHTDYIFTYQMNGCNLVVVQGNNYTYLFHEPTSTNWKTPRTTPASATCGTGPRPTTTTRTIQAASPVAWSCCAGGSDAGSSSSRLSAGTATCWTSTKCNCREPLACSKAVSSVAFREGQSRTVLRRFVVHARPLPGRSPAPIRNNGLRERRFRITPTSLAESVSTSLRSRARRDDCERRGRKREHQRAANAKKSVSRNRLRLRA